MLAELLDREELFKKQIEECEGLARMAVDGNDRAFWERAAAGWKQQLRGIKQKRRRATGKDSTLLQMLERQRSLETARPTD